MDKTEYRAVIKFLVLEGQSSKQVEERLTSVYGQSSPSSSTIKRWVKEFQRGRESLEDDPRSGRPTTSTSPENIEKVHKLVIENRRNSLYELEEATGISYGSIHNILHDELHMSKVCARWVPKMLSDDMKQSRVTISGAMLTRYNTNPDDFHFRVVTCDETWLYHREWMKERKKSPAPSDEASVPTPASVVQWLRVLTLKHWISQRCCSSLSLGTCEMPSSAPVSQVVFLWVLPTSD